MNLRLKYLILLLFLFERGFTQENISQIRIIVHPTKNSIKLRWAPSSAIAWKYLNDYGYRIDRYTIMRDSQYVSEPAKKILTNKPIKPWEMPRWEALANSDDNAAIVAQALYGESFEVSSGQGELSRLVNMSKELENRYSFALFAISQSVEIAEAAGLYYNDTSAKPNENYMYRIISLVPDSIEHVDSAYIYTGIGDYSPLPKPLIFSVDITDQIAIIKWDKIHFENLFNNYIIERSDDNGVSYKKINAAPYVNIYNELNNNSLYYTKNDSVPETNKRYYYRIKGITVFGEVSEPSDTMSAFCTASVKDRPSISDAIISNSGQVMLKWTFPTESLIGIKGFRVMRCSKSEGIYNEISANLIEPTINEYVDNNPLPVNYYKIRAIGMNNNSAESFPFLVQLEDSIPPAIPVNLSGTIDSTGKVTILWNANSETDLKGYLVFRANYLSEEFSQVTYEACSKNVFYDSIPIQTLTRKIYYKIKSIDTHFNQSGFSQILELKRPDIIPPQPPLIYYYKTKPGEVCIKWHKSNSVDVARHLLYKRMDNEKSWRLIYQSEEPDTSSSFVDMTDGKEQFAEYTLIAVDSSKLESEPAQPLRVKIAAKATYNAVNEIYASIGTNPIKAHIQWVYNDENVARYLVYKSEKNQALTLYRSVKSPINYFDDNQVLPGKEYVYRLKVIYESGAESPLSKAIELKF